MTSNALGENGGGGEFSPKWTKQTNLGGNENMAQTRSRGRRRKKVLFFSRRPLWMLPMGSYVVERDVTSWNEIWTYGTERNVERNEFHFKIFGTGTERVPESMAM